MPDITVQNIIPKISYIAAAGDLTYTDYPFLFGILNATDIKVYITPAGDEPNDIAQLIAPATYTVIIATPPTAGGTVRLINPLDVGSRITIIRNRVPQSTNSYQNGNYLSASMLNADFNSNVMLAQENNLYTTMLCPHYNQTEITDNTDYTLARLSPGQVWVKSRMPGGGIIAEDINNVVGGNIVTFEENASVLNRLPRFADTAGNIKGTEITIDDTNNVTNINRITCDTVHSLFLYAVGTEVTRLTADNLEVTESLTVNDTLNVTGLTTLANTNINGTLTTNGAFEPASLTSPGIVMAGSLQLKSPHVGRDGEFKIGTLLGHDYVISNANYGDSIVIAPGGTGSLMLKNAAINTGSVTALKFFDSSNNRCVAIKAPLTLNAASYNLVLPPAQGIGNQTLVLSDPTTGQLIWGAGGGAGGVNAVPPITAGNLAVFGGAAGNITNSGITVSTDANHDMAGMRNITTLATGTVETGLVETLTLEIDSPNGGTCRITKPNGNPYGLVLPPSGPTAINQPLVATSAGINSNCTLGWGDVQPKRAFIKFHFLAQGVIDVTNSTNMGMPTFSPNWASTNKITCNIIRGTFTSNNYITRIYASAHRYVVTFLVAEANKTAEHFDVLSYNYAYQPWYFINWAEPDLFIYVECISC